ncbi:hypothetical protein LJB42_001376 [Komagataella kurtzmanii]|nr:hypothetical protein LJB42_001376 [Komagataella kurtzmanii]
MVFYLDEAVVESDSDNDDGHADLVEHLGANLSSAHPPTRRRKSSVYSKISVHNEDTGNGQISITEYTKGEQETNASILDFEPITVLGQGAYGTVKLVKNKHTSKLYAQKELKKASLVINEKHVERTMEERNILSKISEHPNIVKLFYAFHDHDKLYLMMEYVPGGELFQHLNEEKFLGEDIASFYAAQMGLAINYLHTMGIVYRDLKPENCLLDSQGFLVLTDFGLSKQSLDTGASSIGHDGPFKSIIGTPEYMAPEVLKGDPYSFSCDWWSLGAVIFDMMIGKPPFTGANSKIIMDKIVNKTLKFPYYLTPTAKELLQKLLNKSPAKRDVDTTFNKFQKHSFFRNIDWDALLKRDLTKISPPIVPIITNLELAENFSRDFTDLKLSDDVSTDLNLIPTAKTKDAFQGFSYVASNSYMNRYLGC